jgi:hypothetical protein
MVQNHQYKQQKPNEEMRNCSWPFLKEHGVEALSKSGDCGSCERSGKFH